MEEPREEQSNSNRAIEAAADVVWYWAIISLITDGFTLLVSGLAALIGAANS